MITPFYGSNEAFYYDFTKEDPNPAKSSVSATVRCIAHVSGCLWLLKMGHIVESSRVQSAGGCEWTQPVWPRSRACPTHSPALPRSQVGPVWRGGQGGRGWSPRALGGARPIARRTAAQLQLRTAALPQSQPPSTPPGQKLQQLSVRPSGRVGTGQALVASPRTTPRHAATHSG